MTEPVLSESDGMYTWLNRMHVCCYELRVCLWFSGVTRHVCLINSYPHLSDNKREF